MAKKVKKKELGLGIRALLSDIKLDTVEEQEKSVKKLSKTIALIPLSEITTNPFQPRQEFDQEALKELSASIKIHGLIQPVTVRRLSENEFQLISGERRLRASKLAGLTEVPAYIRLANDQEMLEMALVENIQREQLNAIEVAITYQRLIDECDLTHELLSDRVGKNRSTITNHLRLLKLPPELQKGLRNRDIAMGHARALVGLEDVATQLQAYKEVVAKKLSVRETEALVRKYTTSGTKKKKTPSGLPDEYRKIQDDFSAFFGAKVSLKPKPKGNGQIVISYGSVEELNRIIDLLDK